MAATVLGNISLGYQLLWNRARQPAAVRLFVDDAEVTIDARHLLAALLELWPGRAPLLMLSIQWPPLLLDLLDLLDVSDAQNLWVEIPQDWLEVPALSQRVRQAHSRGLKLVWRGEPGQRPDAGMAPCFHKCVVKLTAKEALLGLQVGQQKSQDMASTPLIQSPVVAGQIYEAVTSRQLADYCLDQEGAWALAGWPTEDVLHGHQSPIQPDQGVISQLIHAIDTDASVEAIEHALCEEPVLAYRFQGYLNSAGLGLRGKVESIRRGLLVLGYRVLKDWLLAQLPQASSDPNLQPVRMAIVTRAHLMERLLDAGKEDDLRREVYLCGLLSQIDLLLGEPLTKALQRLPLPKRIHATLLQQTGPYRPYLVIATALESSHTRVTHALCKLHKISLEEVNRALLRTLASLLAYPIR
jgi:EAL and modified HD-GYP domain-containing signal transduction protein